ncbi:PEPxxWA-CTERM sorting domain-containing protein, partial [Sandarakinorhabdus sp.]
FDASLFGVPEPASWAMLIAGFGLTGAAMRRRRTVVAA